MTLSSTILVPELQYWFNDFVLNSFVNKNLIPLSSNIDEVYMPQASFIELLFNESYSYDEYKYLYTDISNTYDWPYNVKTRMLVFPSSARYLEVGDSGTNHFGIVAEDLSLLNALLQYRIDSTSLIIIDSTSTSFVAPVLHASYDNINSILSKLIFLYLDFKVNGNTSNYDNTITLSQGTLLESCYEVFVLDKMFISISERGT